MAYEMKWSIKINDLEIRRKNVEIVFAKIDLLPKIIDSDVSYDQVRLTLILSRGFGMPRFLPFLVAVFDHNRDQEHFTS